MTSPRDRIRKGVSLWIAALMLVSSVAVPVLERSELVDEPVAESEHNPATCPTGHDHTVCTQVGANASATASPIRHAEELVVLTIATPADAHAVAPTPFPDGHPTRAPPQA